MISCAYSAGICGIEGFPVIVECNESASEKPYLELVGLPDLAVKEAKERVKNACMNSGYPFPRGAVTVNLAPADRKKEGSAFDAAILTAILRNANIIPREVSLEKRCIIGELSLSGELRPVRGILSMCIAAKENGFSEIYVPTSNATEASAIQGIDVYAVKDIRTLVAHLSGKELLQRVENPEWDSFSHNAVNYGVDFSDVRGQESAKRAMEIAAAGGHNILLIGPPGTGKSMLAKRLPSILPPLNFDEAIETTKIHSVAGFLPDNVSLLSTRPFRSPHHTMSAPGLVGGGTNPTPGEISLANNGVLFLDELPEFPKTVTDLLRQPLEDRKITITRATNRVTFPCSFMLVGAMNPCRCGYFGDPTHKCTCRPEDVRRYISKISGPMLDRFDIQVELPAVSFEKISGMDSEQHPVESSASIRERVIKARNFALKRLSEADKKEKNIFCNAQLDPAGVHTYCQTDKEALDFLKSAYERLGLSARGYDRVLRVARTIADMEEAEIIGVSHVAEAIQLRSLDRKYWG